MSSIGLLASAIDAKARECPGFPDHLCIPLGLVMLSGGGGSGGSGGGGVVAVKTQRRFDGNITRRTRTPGAANGRTRKKRQPKR